MADNNKPHVFASFVDESAASKTRNELISEECSAMYGRRFVVKYAELKADPVSPPARVNFLSHARPFLTASLDSQLKEVWLFYASSS